jgi:hypothetical protein
VAFQVGDYTTGCDVQGCDDSSKQMGSIWMQSVTNAPPIRLTNLSDSSPNPADHDLSLEPTFNPIARGGYFWVVFTSERDWGNAITGTPNSGKKRLWVAAVDALPGSPDPSHPAFFLDSQDTTTTNMRGFWSLADCIPTHGGGPCQAGFECCSGFCEEGACVDRSVLACAGLRGACAVTSDCCNAGEVSCQNGTCSANATLR